MRGSKVLRSCAVFSVLVAAMTIPSSPMAVAAPGAAQQMAVPAYFSPGSRWTRMDHAGAPLGLAVVNPDSGPGASAVPAYVSAVKAAQAAGITVIGYVDTDYSRRSISAVESDVDDYYRWYGVDGIFFDRASTSCAKEPYYATLDGYVKGKGGIARTVLNPGTQTHECYATAADILLTFEGSDTTYVNSNSAPSWVSSYPASQFWNVVYGSKSMAAMTHAVELSKIRHVGYVYVTRAGLPNPYDTLPTGAYWQRELSAISN